MLSKRFINDGRPTYKLNRLQKKEVDIVKDKISNGKYKFIKASCPICNESDKFQLISEKDRYGFLYPLVICETCGLVQANPRLRSEDYSDFYEKGHQKRIYVGKERPEQDYFQSQYKRGQKIYSFVKDRFRHKKNISVLEVGCGAGGILKIFEEKGHYVKGIDLNEEYLDYGRNQYRLNLTNQNLFQIENEEYDLIIYSHVLEHLSEPSEHLQFVKKLLSKDGLLYIEVPGIKRSFQIYFDILRYLQNAHIYNFSYQTLSNLMAKNDYVIVNEKNEEIESLWKVSHNPSFKIKSDFEDCISYLKKNNSLLFRIIHYIRRKTKVLKKLLIGQK